MANGTLSSEITVVPIQPECRLRPIARERRFVISTPEKRPLRNGIRQEGVFFGDNGKCVKMAVFMKSRSLGTVDEGKNPHARTDTGDFRGKRH